MARWLFKQEPECYSFADLERDGKTTWDGITNALALQHLRKVKKGDRILFYHSGKQKAIVGEMRAASDARALEEGSKLAVVDVDLPRTLAKPVSLASIKADSTFADFSLVRMSRLSVMPVTPEQWRRIEELSREA